MDSGGTFFCRVIAYTGHISSCGEVHVIAVIMKAVYFATIMLKQVAHVVSRIILRLTDPQGTRRKTRSNSNKKK